MDCLVLLALGGCSACLIRMQRCMYLMVVFLAGTVVDARPQGRFDGTVPEARPGLTSGHMPGSKNIPFSMITNPDKKFEIRPREELLTIFKNAGVDINRKEPIVFSCGSGTTACVDFFAAYLLNRRAPGR